MSVSSEKCGSSKVWHVCSMAQYHNPYYTSWDWDCQHRETMSSTSSKKHVFNLFVMMFRKICPINPIKILLDKRHIFFINLIRIYSFIWSFVWSMNSEYSLQDTGAQSEIHFKESSWKESKGALFSLSIFKLQYQYLSIFMSQYQYLTIFKLQYQYQDRCLKILTNMFWRICQCVQRPPKNYDLSIPHKLVSYIIYKLYKFWPIIKI